MKQLAIAIHALKIMKKRKHLEQNQENKPSNRFYCGLYQKIAIALLIGEITNKLRVLLLQSCHDWL